MPEHSQSSLRPRLEHQASQTIIDLTEEPEEPSAHLRNHREQSRSQRPPQLGRSDSLGFGELIDLTEDNGEEDIIIIGGRELPRENAPRNRRLNSLALRREESPSLFMPLLPGPPRNIHRLFAAPAPDAVGLARVAMERTFHAIQGNHPLAFDLDVLDRFQLLPAQAMPGAMDYRNQAFAEQKPEHVPPKPAKEGFTRSPTEDDTIICPSCEEELVHNKDDEEPVVKKGGKPPTKKEREEHPFWVVKECGHVDSSLICVPFRC